MNRKNPSIAIITPVLISFFVMSFIDLVGTGVDELRQDSNTPAYILQLIPFVAFVWFFLLSVPVRIWQDKIGKKRALNIGILITATGLLFPVLGNTLPHRLCHDLQCEWRNFCAAGLFNIPCADWIASSLLKFVRQTGAKFSCP